LKKEKRIMGAKLISEEGLQEIRIIKMSEMRPCEFGRIIDLPLSGHLVMRTASSIKFEIMDLTDLREDRCWTNKDASTRVELAREGEKYTFKIVGQ
jgi:hypothetical protein